MDEILVKQKAVSCVSEKAKWWEGRRALDSQVEVSVKEGFVFGSVRAATECVCVFSVSEAVEGDGGIAGMLEELAFTSVFRS